MLSEHPSGLPQEVATTGAPGCGCAVRVQPGQQMQIDCIEFRKDGILAAAATLSYSRATFAEFVTDVKLGTLLACHARAFDPVPELSSELLQRNSA